MTGNNVPAIEAFQIAEGMEGKWQEAVAINSDDFYSLSTITYTARWAALMEKRMEETGQSVGELAKQASHDADTDGISGAMYGMAVALLADAWVHGDELRRWHNIEYQIHDEGERANESGATLNPAMLNVGKASSE